MLAYLVMALTMWMISMHAARSSMRLSSRCTIKRIISPKGISDLRKSPICRHLSGKALDDENEHIDFDSKVQETYDKVLGFRMIVSESNEKVKLVKNLQMKKRRDKEGLILLEGHRQVIDALRYGAIPENIFLTERGINGPLGYSLMEAITFFSEATDIEDTNNGDNLYHKIDVISDTIMRKCFSEVENDQGVVAAFRRPNRATYLYTNRKNRQANGDPLVVFLDNISDPGNMGTLIRSSYGFGVDAIIFAGGCDPWAPKVIRSAMGMGLHIPLIETAGWSHNELMDMLGNPSPQQMSSIYPPLGEASQEFQILVADLDDRAIPYYEMDFTKPTLLVVGNEARGPSTQISRHPDATKIFIPMLRDLESLNAAVAGSVILSEAARQKKK